MSQVVSDEVIDEIVLRLVEGLRPERIILFGSHAYGHPTPASDLDLVIVVGESGEPPTCVTGPRTAACGESRSRRTCS